MKKEVTNKLIDDKVLRETYLVRTLMIDKSSAVVSYPLRCEIVFAEPRHQRVPFLSSTVTSRKTKTDVTRIVGALKDPPSA